MFNTNQVRDLVADIFESNNQKSLVQDFEEKFSERFGVEYSIAINSGTSGLHAALYAAGVGVGFFFFFLKGTSTSITFTPFFYSNTFIPLSLGTISTTPSFAVNLAIF